MTAEGKKLNSAAQFRAFNSHRMATVLPSAKIGDRGRQKTSAYDLPMKHEFKVGDHVEWNSEAGRVRGTIKRKVTSKVKFKTYTVHASKEEPQYMIKSDKTEHMAMHKGSALTKVRTKS